MGRQERNTSELGRQESDKSTRRRQTASRDRTSGHRRSRHRDTSSSTESSSFSIVSASLQKMMDVTGRQLGDTSIIDVQREPHYAKNGYIQWNSRPMAGVHQQLRRFSKRYRWPDKVRLENLRSCLWDKAVEFVDKRPKHVRSDYRKLLKALG